MWRYLPLRRRRFDDTTQLIDFQDVLFIEYFPAPFLQVTTINETNRIYVVCAPTMEFEEPNLAWPLRIAVRGEFGTGALVFVVYRKKYYCVAHHVFGGDVDELGASLIPLCHEDEYEACLEQKRAKFEEVEKAIKNWYVVGEFQGCVIPINIYGLPSELPPDPSSYITINHTYVFNLDKEVFTFDGGAHFKLKPLTRHEKGQWSDALAIDKTGKQTVSLQRYPEDDLESLIARTALEPSDRAKANDWYQTQHIYPVLPRTDITGRQILFGLTVSSFYQHYYHSCIAQSLSWETTQFLFQEWVFAIVSLAAGEVQYAKWTRSSRRYCGWATVTIGGKKSNLPEFGHACHRRNEIPGAAPRQQKYWFNDVLISLANSTQDVDMRKLCLKETVQFGLSQNRSNFLAAILSPIDVILLEVKTTNGKTSIKLTEPIQLAPIQPADCQTSHPKERPPNPPEQDGHDDEVLENIGAACRSQEDFRQQFPGFVALMNLFAANTNRLLRNSREKLPADIRDIILHNLEAWEMPVADDAFVWVHKPDVQAVDIGEIIGPRTLRIHTSRSVFYEEIPAEFDLLPVFGRQRRVVVIDARVCASVINNDNTVLFTNQRRKRKHGT